MIGKVVKVTGAGAAAKGGDATSVNGIAGGIKGIVAAAEKAGEEGKLESEAAAAGEANEDAGKLFATKKKDAGGGAKDAEKAGKEGKLESEEAAGEANAEAGKLFAKKANAANGGGGAEAAEKAAAANGDADMIGKVVKVTANTAAAKGGDATSVNGIASGIKGIVAAAEKAGEEGKLESEAAG
ncbi:hypothetical protein LRB59_06335, partial [Borreliella burgdorferi]|nr:hypothetical protein [Borreliella burgdorferi]